MAILDRAAILGAADRRTDAVAVPEWGGEVRVRTMSGADRDAYEQSLLASRGGDAEARLANVRARLAAYCIVDEEGNRLFSDADIEALGAKSAAALDRVFEAASRLNAIAPDDLEALAKN